MKATTIGFALAAAGCMAVAGGGDARAVEGPAEYDAVIAKHSAATGVPETLIRRVIVRESKYNPRAMNRGHYGMMQIKPATAKAMGYRGSAAGLLDADVNLTYGVRYLAGAYKVAAGDHDRAVRYYASGYYYDAKRKGMLAQIGMGRNGALSAPPAAPVALASAAPTATPPGARVATMVPEPRPGRGSAGPGAAAARRDAAGCARGRDAHGHSHADAARARRRRPADPDRVGPAGRAASAGPAGRSARRGARRAQLAAAAPVAPARNADPQTTGSIAVAAPARPAVPTPPIRAVASVAPAQQPAGAKARVISPVAAPVLASAGPAPATARPAPAPLAYSSEPAAKTPFPPRR
ncbi:lytic transglycosylase domain-containing protein [Chenggangzhangella methanolivorans]|uniref:lytic transglycosylase domain-containing protein n=1 Tax=Chenggangzhangella methanolivorans TaxID=1437009 RepID=UPI0021BDAF1B|nr:lytic transglycosylase domain-containing protein [Chenggangzhangella methanolivorans]